MPHPAPHRLLAGLLLLGLLALPAVASARHIRWNVHLWHRLRQAHREAPQTALDESVRRIGMYLPGHGEVGLVQTGAPSLEASSRTLYQVQYALAPRLVRPSACCEFVIVWGPAMPPLPADAGHYAQIADVDGEIRLFRRVRR